MPHLLNRFDTIHDGFGTDQHSWTAAVGTVIDLMVLKVRRPIPEVVNDYFNQTLVNRFCEEALS